MKSQKGITLVSLVIYVIVMMLVLGIMGVIINNFSNNTESIQTDTKEILEFNKFNIYFLKEVKLDENSVDNIVEKQYILFSSGNSFSFNNNSIYYNDKIICRGVQDVSFTFRKYTNDQGEEKENEKVIDVSISFENFNKSISYKLEEIY